MHYNILFLSMFPLVYILPVCLLICVSFYFHLSLFHFVMHHTLLLNYHAATTHDKDILGRPVEHVAKPVSSYVEYI